MTLTGLLKREIMVNFPARWREVILFLTGGSTVADIAPAVLNAPDPTNIFPIDAGLGASAPVAGTYLCRFTTQINTDAGVLAGAFLSNTVLGNFTVNGAPTGIPDGYIPQLGVDPSPIQTWSFERKLPLAEGDVVGVGFGFLAAKVTDLHLMAGRSVTIQLAS